MYNVNVLVYQTSLCRKI